MSSGYTSFYHYTSEEGLQGIIDSGEVRQSTHHNNHAHFGQGAYGTSLPPSAGQKQIAENNWESHGDIYVSKGKVSRAIEVQIPHDRVYRADCDGRDILVHDGPINLNDFNWRTWTVPVDSDNSKCGNSDAKSENHHKNGKHHNYSGNAARGGNGYGNGMHGPFNSGNRNPGYYAPRGRNGYEYDSGMQYNFSDPFNSGYGDQGYYGAWGGNHYDYDGYHYDYDGYHYDYDGYYYDYDGYHYDYDGL